MKILMQVCGVAYAEKLEELGVEQDSAWYWAIYTDKWFLCSKEDALSGDVNNYFSAFTVAELGEMLPNYYYSYIDDSGTWNCITHLVETGKRAIKVYAMTEADARAKMLIWLKGENK